MKEQSRTTEHRNKANGLAMDKRIYNSVIFCFISPFLPDFCQILPGKGPKVLKKEHIFFGFLLVILVE